MDEKAKRRNSYVVASCPLVIAGLQVLLGSAPLAMLGFGACMSFVAFLMFGSYPAYAYLERARYSSARLLRCESGSLP